MELKLAYFYPTLMNLYGDRGNVQAIVKRCEWRGIKVNVTEIGIGDTSSLSGYDLAFFGGGQDKEQFKIGEDLLKTKAKNLKAAAQDGLVLLAICGGLQLLGEYYRPIHGPVLRGISLLDLHTEGGTWRAIGNIIIKVDLHNEKNVLVPGFENHSGRTYLGTGCLPLGKVVKGFGNNGDDGSEGAHYRNCIGTYLHGPLLPKNPMLADYLISLALHRKYGRSDLEPLDDVLEAQTRTYILKRIKKQYLIRGKIK